MDQLCLVLLGLVMFLVVFILTRWRLDRTYTEMRKAEREKGE